MIGFKKYCKQQGIKLNKWHLKFARDAIKNGKITQQQFLRCRQFPSLFLTLCYAKMYLDKKRKE